MALDTGVYQSAGGDGICTGTINAKTQFAYAPQVYLDVIYRLLPNNDGSCNQVPQEPGNVEYKAMDGSGIWYEAFKIYSGNHSGYIFWNIWVNGNVTDWRVNFGGNTKYFYVSPPPCTPTWICEQPANGYEKDGCGNRRLNSACNPPPCTPTWVCEQPANGYEKDGCGNRRLNSVCNTATTTPDYTIFLIVLVAGILYWMDRG